MHAFMCTPFKKYRSPPHSIDSEQAHLILSPCTVITLSHTALFTSSTTTIAITSTGDRDGAHFWKWPKTTNIAQLTAMARKPTPSRTTFHGNREDLERSDISGCEPEFNITIHHKPRKHRQGPASKGNERGSELHSGKFLNTVKEEIFVGKKISYFSARNLSYGIKFCTLGMTKKSEN